MELITILNRCYRFRGFVYHHAHFSADKKSIEVAVRPRKGSAANAEQAGRLRVGKNWATIGGRTASQATLCASVLSEVPADGRTIVHRLQLRRLYLPIQPQLEQFTGRRLFKLNFRPAPIRNHIGEPPCRECDGTESYDHRPVA